MPIDAYNWSTYLDRLPSSTCQICYLLVTIPHIPSVRSFLPRFMATMFEWHQPIKLETWINLFLSSSGAQPDACQEINHITTMRSPRLIGCIIYGRAGSFSVDLKTSFGLLQRWSSRSLLLQLLRLLPTFNAHKLLTLKSLLHQMCVASFPFVLIHSQFHWLSPRVFAVPTPSLPVPLSLRNHSTAGSTSLPSGGVRR